MIKSAAEGSGANWVIMDNKRNPFNRTGKYLRADLNNAEGDDSSYGGTNWSMDMLSNGIKISGGDVGLNKSGDKYIYMAFAEEPLVASNFVPTTAR